MFAVFIDEFLFINQCKINRFFSKFIVKIRYILQYDKPVITARFFVARL